VSGWLVGTTPLYSLSPKGMIRLLRLLSAFLGLLVEYLLILHLVIRLSNSPLQAVTLYPLPFLSLTIGNMELNPYPKKNKQYLENFNKLILKFPEVIVFKRQVFSQSETIVQVMDMPKSIATEQQGTNNTVETN
jgi:hypothetical protein